MSVARSRRAPEAPANVPVDRGLGAAPMRGDFATGARREPRMEIIVGDFAVGARRTAAVALSHAGDYAVGLRTTREIVVGDFATGARTIDRGPAPAPHHRESHGVARHHHRAPTPATAEGSA